MTRVRAVVSDTVKVAIRDSVNYVYENKWLTARLNTNTRTLQYSYNVELIDVKYTKRQLADRKTNLPGYFNC
ncbi:hypothetical protein ACFFJX_27620 [Pseudarcicella hirudinis]|uniref:hypothetical protein n=1 Tax=Pseudarcicella hirudinis TaxID=1079859 RepID=UPI0035EE86A9